MLLTPMLVSPHAKLVAPGIYQLTDGVPIHQAIIPLPLMDYEKRMIVEAEMQEWAARRFDREES